MNGASSDLNVVQCDIDFMREGRQVGHMLVPQSTNESAWGGVRIPIVMLRNGDGPGLLLTAGVHGDEFEGQIVLMELARELDVAQIRGCVIIIPSLHLPACRAGTRLSPVDGRDINRSFPGDPAGSFAQKLAFFLTHRILPLVETNIDLHSGGRSLECMTCTMSHLLEDAEAMERTMALAARFGAPLHVMNREVDGASTFQATAESLGIVSLSSELGGAARVSIEGLEIGRKGVRNAMAALDITSDAAPPARSRTRFMTIPDAGDYGFSPVSGIFAPRLVLGSLVKRGDVVGRVHALAGDPDAAPHDIVAPRAGMLWCQRGLGRIDAGDSSAVVVSPLSGALS